jgi:hypothetical protein
VVCSAEEERAALQSRSIDTERFARKVTEPPPGLPEHLRNTWIELAPLRQSLISEHDSYLGTEHLLLALSRLDSGRVFEMLTAFQVDRARLRDEMERNLYS